MRVIANRQLRGEYGTVLQDQEFEVRDELAAELMRSGMVRHALPPRVEYQTKIIVPEAPEVSARQPFRDVLVPDEKPAHVAAEGDRVLPGANVCAGGAARSGGRRGR